MKGIVPAAVFVLIAGMAAAQPIQIHDGIGKTVYNSSSEWNDVSSQQHWSPCDDAMVVDDMCHVHLNIVWPDDGELTAGPMQVPFYITLFKFHGHITQIGSFEGVADNQVTWASTNPVDATGEIGDPAGVQVLNGTFTIDIGRFYDQTTIPLLVPLHGWGAALFRVQAALDNGAEPFVISQSRRFWSNLDPTAPVTLGGGGFSTDGSGFGVTHVNEFSGWKQDFSHGWNVNDGNLPFNMHLVGPTDVMFHVYSYGDPIIASPEAVAQDCRLDPDLHHGIQGALLPCTFAYDSGEATVGGFHNGHYSVHLDPALMGLGTHHIMLRITDNATGPSVSGFPAFSAATITNFTVIVDKTDGVQPVYPACSLQGPFGVTSVGPGVSTMLLATAKDATALTVDPPVATFESPGVEWNGGFWVSPATSTTYTLTASNAFGSQSCLYGLTVGDVPPPVVVPPPPVVVSPPPPVTQSCTTVSSISTDGGADQTPIGSIVTSCQ
jgi:hypothetical protein